MVICLSVALMWMDPTTLVEEDVTSTNRFRRMGLFVLAYVIHEMLIGRIFVLNVWDMGPTSVVKKY